MDFQVRPPRPSDLSFVYDTWLNSWRVSKWAGTLPNNLYYEAQRQGIDDLIARGAQILIAYPPHRDSFILGWACGEEKDGQTVLHYLYVRDPYLVGYGIQAGLISQLPGSKPGFVTHWQNLKETRQWRHVPEMARRNRL